jgi:predicted TIM-barrel fold metal-dependent hydrolase
LVIDAHAHTKGGESAEHILAAMDTVGIDRMVLMGAPPDSGFPLERELKSGSDLHKQSIDAIAALVAFAPDRLIGFAWIEPTLPDALEGVDYALGEKGLSGIKMIPKHWYPADERAQACYQRIEPYGKPMLFHSGILWGVSDTSQYCRPAYYEIMLHYPRIRFALAHMSWPWTDECFAVLGKFRANLPEWNSYADTTSGPPPVWKVDAYRKALAWLGDDHLIYGSDWFCGDVEELRNSQARERRILGEAGASPETVQRVLHDNALRWLGIS